MRHNLVKFALCIISVAGLSAVEVGNDGREVTYNIPTEDSFNHQFGLRITGEILQITASPDAEYRLWDCRVSNPTPLNWVGVNPFLCAIPGQIFAGEHTGAFRGKYGKDGGSGPGGGTPPTWNGKARATQIEVRHRTVAATPASQNRTKLGLCEEVVFFTFPTVEVNWSIDAGGTLTTNHGSATIATMPLAETNVTVTATYRSESIPTNCSVIKPTDVVITAGTRLGSGTVMHRQGSPGAGFAGHPISLFPDDVSFYNIKVFEGEATAMASGVFAHLDGDNHPLGTAISVGQDNDLLAADKIRTLGVVPPSGNLRGIFIWNIPWYATKTSGGTGLLMFNVQHKCASNNVGTADQTKAGGQAIFALNDPTWID